MVFKAARVSLYSSHPKGPVEEWEEDQPANTANVYDDTTNYPQPGIWQDHSAHLNTPCGSPAQLQQDRIAANNSNLHTSARSRRKSYGPEKRVLGLAQDREPPPSYAPPDDYTVRYRADWFGEEMNSIATVWRVYLDEAKSNDHDMVEGWNNGIDVLLVFAGLFSVVVTIFVVQTSHKLDQDFGQISASLLTELTAIQRAAAAGSPVQNVSSSEFSFSSPPRFTKDDIWINALWFTSLTLSLVTALSAILIKQWIQHYVSFVTGTPKERARIHQFRYVGLQRWGVRGIISVLPVLLYAALFLFMGGLAIFLRVLKPEIAYVVGAIGGLAFILFLITNTLPLFFPQCPYYTPLIEPIYTAITLGFIACRRSAFPFTHRAIPWLLSRRWVPFFRHERLNYLNNWCQRVLVAKPPTYTLAGLKVNESKAAELDQDKIICDIISWMMTMSSNPSVKAVALQAISGLPIGFSRIDELLGEGSLVRKELVHELEIYGSLSRHLSHEPSELVQSGQFHNTERILRASMFIPTSIPAIEYPIWEPPDWVAFDKAVGDLDAGWDFQLASMTYRVYSALNGEQSDIFPALYTLSDSMRHCPVLWKAWLHALYVHVSHWQWTNTYFPTLYGRIRPFVKELLVVEGETMAWDLLLPVLGRLLPVDLVGECFNDPLEVQLELTPEIIHSKQAKLRIILLKCIVAAWNYDPGSLALDGIYKMEDVVNDVCQFLEALDELIGHPSFPDTRWEIATYQQLFKVYLEACHESSAAIPRAFSSQEYFCTILAQEECAAGLWNVLASFPRGGPHLPAVISQIIDALQGNPYPKEQTIQSAFGAFLRPLPDRRSLASQDFLEILSPWPCYMQPLVHWMLDYLIAYYDTGDSHSPIITFATDLIEQPGFLKYVCASFLFGPHPDRWAIHVVLTDDSNVLLQLAAHHKDKPGALEVWQTFLTWVRDSSIPLHVLSQYHDSWTRADFERYERMADLVNDLVGTLEIDDPELRVPHFGEDRINSILMQQHGKLPSEQFPSINVEPKSSYVTRPKVARLRKLLPWKDSSGVGGNQRDIDLESNQL